MKTHITKAPLTPREMVPDIVLRDLAKGGPERQMGELSEEHTAILAMYLPEICGELLHYRLTGDLKREEHQRAVKLHRLRRQRRSRTGAGVLV